MKYLLAWALSLAAAVAGTQASPKQEAASEMAAGAAQFLRGLSSDQRALASLPFEGDERTNWHYIPRERKGIPYTQMSPAQRKLADSLLVTGLSPRAMHQAFAIMYLDQILFEAEKRDIRNPDLYYFTVFGEPGATGRWGFRVEGHHLSLNFTLSDGEVVSSSPAFLGANPAIVRSGPHEGMRVLAAEELLGRELLHAFEDRSSVVVLKDAPRDIVTEASRRVEIGLLKKPPGVSFADMTPAQKERVRALVAFYANRMRPELAEVELRRIEKAGEDKIHFAWAGGANPGEPHYYRIHGPTFLIEYDNTQNNANHIHTVWRDLERDFGEAGPLTAHYLTSPHHRGGERAHRHAEPR